MSEQTVIATEPKYTVEGSAKTGWWVNVGPGINRVGPIFPTRAAAERALGRWYR